MKKFFKLASVALVAVMCARTIYRCYFGNCTNDNDDTSSSFFGKTFKDGRYIALRKLGASMYGSVWLCYDFWNKRHCAIKFHPINLQVYKDAVDREVDVINHINRNNTARTPFIKLHDSFELNDNHHCLVFDAVGKSLLDLVITDGQRLPISTVKILCRQILLALEFLHDKCGIIHTDVRLSNILLTFTKAENEKLRSSARKAAIALKNSNMSGSENSDRVAEAVDDSLKSNGLRITMIDYGKCWMGGERLTGKIQSMPYRAPEVNIGCGYSAAIDIWSFACLVYGLATGKYLFSPPQQVDKPFSRRELLRQMVELLGDFPSWMVNSGTQSCDLFQDGKIKGGRKLKARNLGEELSLQMDASEAKELESFLSAMLVLDFKKRPSAKDMLEHPFVNDEQTVRETKKVMGIED